MWYWYTWKKRRETMSENVNVTTGKIRKKSMFDLCVFKMKGKQLITDRNRALNEKQWISCYKERTKMEKGNREN